MSSHKCMTQLPFHYHTKQSNHSSHIDFFVYFARRTTGDFVRTIYYNNIIDSTFYLAD